VPYQGVQVLLTTWTSCRVCGCVVAHLDQRLHDAWHAAQAEPEPPVLEAVS